MAAAVKSPRKKSSYQMSQDSGTIETNDGLLQMDPSVRQREREKVESILTEETDFSLRHQKYLLTYATFLDRDLVEQHLSKMGVIDEILIGHEIGTSNKVPYNHTHVAVAFKKSLDFRRNAAHLFCMKVEQDVLDNLDTIPDCGKIHPNIRWVKRSINDWNTVKRYVTKSDKTDSGKAKSKEKPTVGDKVAAAADVVELVSNLNNFTEVSGAIMAFNILKKPNEEVEPLSHAWQLQLRKLLGGMALDKYLLMRKVVVIMNRGGNIGKTEFTRHVMLNEPSCWHFAKASMNSKDFGSYLGSCLMEGWKGPYWVFDMPKTQQECTGIYHSIECLKDGMASSQKWQGRGMIFQRSLVVLFSNWWPEPSRLSKDRWLYLRLDGPDDLLRQVSIEEVWKDIENDYEGHPEIEEHGCSFNMSEFMKTL